MTTSTQSLFISLTDEEIKTLKSYIRNHIPHRHEMKAPPVKTNTTVIRWLVTKDLYTGCYELTIINHTDERKSVSLTRQYHDKWGIETCQFDLSKLTHPGGTLHYGHLADWVSHQQTWLNQVKE